MRNPHDTPAMIDPVVLEEVLETICAYYDEGSKMPYGYRDKIRADGVGVAIDRACETLARHGLWYDRNTQTLRELRKETP